VANPPQYGLDFNEFFVLKSLLRNQANHLPTKEDGLSLVLI